MNHKLTLQYPVYEWLRPRLSALIYAILQNALNNIPDATRNFWDNCENTAKVYDGLRGPKLKSHLVPVLFMFFNQVMIFNFPFFKEILFSHVYESRKDVTGHSANVP